MASVTVLCPNAHRVIVKTTPNTSMLQILEEACIKYQYNPDLYSLKHMRRQLDMSSTLRFSGVPNRCVLEMSLLAKPRTQQLVTICLIDQHGSKHIHEHQPTASLWNVLENSVGNECLQEAGVVPSVVYSMRRVAGQDALTATTLKALGLSAGKGSMRFSLDKEQSDSPERNEMQPPVQVAPVIVVAPMPEVIPIQMPEIIPIEIDQPEIIPVIVNRPEIVPINENRPEIIPINDNRPEIVPINENRPEVIPINDNRPEIIPINDNRPEVVRISDDRAAVCPANEAENVGDAADVVMADCVMSPDVVSSSQSCVPDVIASDASQPPDVLNYTEPSSSSEPVFPGAGRSLSVVTQQPPSQFMEVDSTQDTATVALSSHSCVVFRGSDLPDTTAGETDEDDDFYKLTVKEVKKLHKEQQLLLRDLTDAPLQTQGLRAAEQQSRVLATLHKFPVTQLRIHFPGDVVVQASFRPTDTVQDVAAFVVGLLRSETMEFELLNHYPRVALARHCSLHDAGLVPKAHVHVSCAASEAHQLLQPAVLQSITSYRQAQHALTAGRNGEQSSKGLGNPGPGPAIPPQPASAAATRYIPPSDTKKPKWFKLGK